MNFLSMGGGMNENGAKSKKELAKQVSFVNRTVNWIPLKLSQNFVNDKMYSNNQFLAFPMVNERISND